MRVLAGKVALVTGAGQGIGQGIAFALASEDAAVVVFGRTAEKLEQTCATIADRGGTAMPLACNVKDADELANAVAEAVARFGGVDVLVNNAQEVPMGRLMDVSDEAFTAGFESGPLAVHRLMKLVRPHMVARGGGVIVNLISSASVRWDMAGYGAYAAVKKAIHALTRAAAAEWGRDGIRALSIAPHADSPGLRRWIERNPGEAEAFFRSIPLGRVGRLEEDIGRAVVALCSPDMAYLTGAIVPLDGGQASFG